MIAAITAFKEEQDNDKKTTVSLRISANPFRTNSIPDTSNLRAYPTEVIYRFRLILVDKASFSH